LCSSQGCESPLCDSGQVGSEDKIFCYYYLSGFCFLYFVPNKTPFRGLKFPSSVVRNGYPRNRGWILSGHNRVFSSSKRPTPALSSNQAPYTKSKEHTVAGVKLPERKTKHCTSLPSCCAQGKIYYQSTHKTLNTMHTSTTYFGCHHVEITMI